MHHAQGRSQDLAQGEGKQLSVILKKFIKMFWKLIKISLKILNTTYFLI